MLGRNQEQNQDKTQSNNNQRGSFLSSIFGEDDNTDSQANNRVNAETNANLNLRSDSSRLPTSLQQQQPRKYQRQDAMMALSPLHLTRIEGNTWRTGANPALVHGIMARLLSQNYIISSVDRKNFNIQTDWDKFFIDGRLFRNRISVTIFPVGARQTEVVIKNLVEYYTGTLAKQEENMAWLPCPDLTDEVNKLVENTDKQTAFAYSQSMSRN